MKRIFAAETSNYFLLLGTTLFLVVFGLVMVLSSSSVESHLENDSSFASFARQGLYALLGIPFMLVASRMPATFWKRWAWPAIFAGMGLQLLVFVPGIGWGYGGNQNWIKLGPLTAQPSELLKLAIIVWIAYILTSKEGLLDEWKHVLVPIGPVAGLGIGLVLIGNDLGTAVIMLSIVFGALYFAGIKIRFLLTGISILAFFGVIVAFASSSRTERIMAWFNGCTPEQYERFCWQPTHGTWALASGGVFGVGLGNSKAKWSWLPEADNDYIFAIIGEELGLVGAIVVLVLFIVLALSFIRIIRSSSDAFARIVTAGVGIWIIGQALVNIAVVLGVLPVLGVPLPLISAGGSALISTLLAIGVVLSFARDPSVVTTPQGMARFDLERVRPTPARPRTTRTAATARSRAVAPEPPAPLTPAERSRLAAAERARARSEGHGR
ncbi:MAG: ftsW [Microbacteriaceae bacterium]|nr:ftsW [Microbacteriaceae bacterium]